MKTKPYWTVLRVTQVLLLLTLIVIFVLRPEIITLATALMFLISVIFSRMVYRRGDNTDDERSRRIEIRSGNTAFAVLTGFAGISIIGARFIPGWPNSPELMVLVIAIGSAVRDFSEYWYRFG